MTIVAPRWHSLATAVSNLTVTRPMIPIYANQFVFTADVASTLHSW